MWFLFRFQEGAEARDELEEFSDLESALGFAFAVCALVAKHDTQTCCEVAEVESGGRVIRWLGTAMIAAQGPVFERSGQLH